MSRSRASVSALSSPAAMLTPMSSRASSRNPNPRPPSLEGKGEQGYLGDMGIWRQGTAIRMSHPLPPREGQGDRKNGIRGVGYAECDRRSRCAGAEYRGDGGSGEVGGGATAAAHQDAQI